jgi:hypothetical protein
MKMIVEKPNFKHILFFAFIIFSVMVINVLADAPAGQPDGDFSPERALLDELGLPRDANDSQIINLLNVPGKRSSAVLLIRYKRIQTAVPNLLEIVKNDKILAGERIVAAEALCDFNNRDWVPIIKSLKVDPNSDITLSFMKYNVAGLLARAGDYSQFEIVAEGLRNQKVSKYTVIQQLGYFADISDPVTDKAANLLSEYSKSNDNPKYREYAIESLEKLAKVKPQLKEKVIEVLEANKNSTDKYLRETCNIKLMFYKKPSEPNNP